MPSRRLFLAVFVSLALVAGGTLASADPSGGAVVLQAGTANLPKSVSGLGCNLGTANLSGYQKVITPSGTVVFVVSFDIPEAFIPNHTLRNAGFLAVVEGQLSSKTHCLANPAGKAFLNVIVNPSRAPGTSP